MKIAHVIASLDPAAGGPPVVAINLAVAEARLGHQVQMIAHQFPRGVERVSEILASSGANNLVQIHAIPAPSRIERFTGMAARAAIGGRIGNVDILHIHGVWDVLVKAGADVAWANKVPYVVTPHGMLHPWSLAQKRLKKQVALKLSYQRMLDRASLIHVLNRDEGLRIPLRLVPPFATIPNGISLEELANVPPAGAFYADYSELKGQPFILFLSRLHYKKGLDYLADAFSLLSRRMPDVRLVVVGPDDGARTDFEKRIREAGVTDRTHVIGPLFDKRKFAALRDASCFCLPSRQEGFSMAILEAMALRLPVVISEECHFPEVSERRAGAVLPLSAAAFADSLQSFLEDESLRKRAGEAGRQLVEEKFTWPEIGKQIAHEYEAVLERWHKR